MTQNKKIEECLRLFKSAKQYGITKQDMINAVKDTSTAQELETLSIIYDISGGEFTHKSKENTIKNIEQSAGLMMCPVSGRCMERENIFDGDYILVDLNRYPHVKEKDIALITTIKSPDKTAVKQYLGVPFGFQSFGTCYTKERLKAEGLTFDFAVRADKILGVVCACYTPDGFLRWERDVSDRSDEMPTAQKKITHKADKVQKIPILFNKTGILDTIEGCLLYNMSRDIYFTVRDEFNKLPEDIRHAMAFSPKAGTWVSRAETWRNILSAALEPKQIHQTMICFVRWYRKCIKNDFPGELKP